MSVLILVSNGDIQRDNRICSQDEYNVQRTMSNVQSPTYNIQRTKSNVRYPTYNVQRTKSYVQCPPYDVHRTMSNVQCPTYNVRNMPRNVRNIVRHVRNVPEIWEQRSRPTQCKVQRVWGHVQDQPRSACLVRMIWVKDQHAALISSSFLSSLAWLPLLTSSLFFRDAA